MLNNVSGVGYANSVNFGQRKGTQDVPDFTAPQAYPRQDLNAPETAKKGNKFWKTVGKIALTAAVIAGALAIGSKTGAFDKVLSKYSNWVAEGKLPNWLMNDKMNSVRQFGGKVLGLAKTGGDKLIEWGTKGLEAAKGLFSRAPEVVEEAEEVAAAV